MLPTPCRQHYVGNKLGSEEWKHALERKTTILPQCHFQSFELKIWPYSLLFMTMICDIKTKDPFSIISRGEHLKGWKKISYNFFLPFLWNDSLGKNYLAVKWKRRSSPVCICSRKKIIARVNHNQLETFAEITEHLDLSFLELHAPRTSKWTIFGSVTVLDQNIIKIALK